MKRDFVDFFLVEDRHLPIHARLENWAMWVNVAWAAGRTMAPIWCLGRSNGRQWHEPLIRVPVDTLDAHRIEKAVAALPAPNRDALRWAYVFRSGPGKARRSLAVTNEGLMSLIKDARTMLTNRLLTSSIDKRRIAHSSANNA